VLLLLVLLALASTVPPAAGACCPALLPPLLPAGMQAVWNQRLQPWHLLPRLWNCEFTVSLQPQQKTQRSWYHSSLWPLPDETSDKINIRPCSARSLGDKGWHSTL
jgi:hypothetical protein